MINKISIILPSRERLELLLHFLNFAIKRAHDPKNIEILVVVDSDDKSGYNTTPMHKNHLENGINYSIYNKQNLKSYKERIEFFVYKNNWQNYIKIIEQKVRIKSNNERHNIAARFARGDLIWTLGDDCEILTQDWDKIILEKINNSENIPNDNAYYICINDGSHKREQPVCAFPIMSRGVIEKLGVLWPEEFYNWGCDFFVFEIFNRSKIKRIINIWDFVSVNHYSYFSQFDHLKRPIDKTLERTKELSKDPKYGCYKKT